MEISSGQVWVHRTMPRVKSIIRNSIGDTHYLSNTSKGAYINTFHLLTNYRLDISLTLKNIRKRVKKK